MSEDIEILMCNRTEGTKRKFKKSDGLFDKGIKKVDTLTYDEQIQRIKEFSFVRAFNPKKKRAKLSLGWAGEYVVELKWHRPRVWRKDTNSDAKNPFINSSTNRLCLGNMQPYYSRCYNNNNYVECIKIIAAVLQSPDTERTYKKWDSCGGYNYHKVYI